MNGVGIFGGTFNPVHTGHLRAALEIGELFSLEKVFFVPAYIPPHKMREDIGTVDERLTMLRGAIRGMNGFSVSEIEIKRGGVSYSIDTIQYFEKRFDDVYFLIGLDAFAEIETWHRFTELFSHANFIVMMRPACNVTQEFTFLPERIRGMFEASAGSIFRHASGRKIFFQAITQLDISSTMIRRAVRENKAITYLVPPAVERFIKKRRLYTA